MNATTRAVIQLAKAFLIVSAFVLIMSLVWDLLEWMRNYGNGTPLIPTLTAEEFKAGLTAAPGQNDTWIGKTAYLINIYNLVFLGAARFGSALGLVFGGAYVLCKLESESRLTKSIAAFILGALIGGRIALLITSSVPYFLFGTIFGALLLAAITSRTSPYKNIPDLH